MKMMDAPDLAADHDLDGLFQGYTFGPAFDEMFDREGQPRPHYQTLYRRLCGLSSEEFRRRKAMTDLSMLQDGVGLPSGGRH